MRTTPISSPHAIKDGGTNPQAAADAKARAIAKLTSPSVPVPVDANNVSAEEIGAVKVGQPDNIVEDTQTSEAVETAPETPKAPPVEQPPSSQMAILARKERALRAKAQQQDQAFKAREAAIKAREDAVLAKDSEYTSGYISKQRIKDDLLGVMAEEGLSYDELTQQLINQQPENPRVKAQFARLEAQNKALEAKLLAMEKNTQDQQTSAYKSALKQIETDVKQLVYTDPNFETVKETRSVRDVVELIEETYKKDGVLLSVEEAAQQVEDYLIDEALKLAKLKKIRTRLNQPPATQGKAQSQTPVTNKQPQPMKTLTNATSSTRQLSAKERAVLAFKGELKP